MRGRRFRGKTHFGGRHEVGRKPGFRKMPKLCRTPRPMVGEDEKSPRKTAVQ